MEKNKMYNEIPHRMLMNRNRLNINQQVSFNILKHRLQICRSCLHWKETPNQYRCYKCKCSCDLIINCSASCPLDTPKW